MNRPRRHAKNRSRVKYFSPSIAMNRLTNLVDAVGTTAYAYDAAGQLLNEGGLWLNDTVSYTYANRLRTGLSVLAPNASAWTQGYGYDSARRLTNVVSLAGGFGYAYDSTRQLQVARLSLPNGAYVTNGYDGNARLLSTVLKNSGNAVLDSEAYAYNQGNQRTGETNTAGDYRNYTYDNLGELKTALGAEAGGVTNRWQEQFGYAYDAAGNLNFRTNNALVQTFNVNSLNELTTITNAGKLTVAGTTTSPATNVTVNTSNAVIYADVTFASTNQPWVNGNNTFTAIAKDAYGRRDTNSITVNLQPTNSYTYDLNGNMITNGNQVLDYDDENQLIRVTVTNAWKSEFSYDGKMRRRILKEFTWNGSSWTQTNEVHFIYDGNLVVQERDAHNLPLVTYTRAGSSLLARTDNLLLNGSSPLAHAYYHADGNRNITCLIYANQQIAAKYAYDSFGNILSMSGALASANVYRFAGKEWNERTGFYYFARRYYDPNLQRFINRDPIGERGGRNLYEYCRNNPVSLIDLLGLCPPGQSSLPPWLQPIDMPQEDYSLWGSFIDSLGMDADQIGYSLFDAPPQLALEGSDILGYGLSSAFGAGGDYLGNSDLFQNIYGNPNAYDPNLLRAQIATETIFTEALTAAPSAITSIAGKFTADASAPSFIVTKGGEAIPIPEGVSGPYPTRNGLGFQLNGGAGGNGLAPNVTDVRIMDNGYVNYGSRQADGGWQSVNPYTGKALVGKSDPWWHAPINNK